MTQVDRRKELNKILLTLAPNVYFQPPANVEMKYPCIVYERSNLKPKFADNNPYNVAQSYQVTVIDRNPDSEIPYEVSQLPMCSFNRHFTVDNLNHDVFTLFY